ncbi:hypothetical protein Kpho02_46570 [Kitasatospora phosalacinea]|uniref:Uncharacterized protein n=1 Tax=Kitasatospora phosalacinea TaxID=2065 RepID=A0A9W6QC92_9ACTN|nr:hypothetical protein Kpho02_46570 [Kitasatospora phosalacinea]
MQPAPPPPAQRKNLELLARKAVEARAPPVVLLADCQGTARFEVRAESFGATVVPTSIAECPRAVGPRWSPAVRTDGIRLGTFRVTDARRRRTTTSKAPSPEG